MHQVGFFYMIMSRCTVNKTLYIYIIFTALCGIHGYANARQCYVCWLSLFCGRCFRLYCRLYAQCVGSSVILSLVY